jgi:hypothetical protein
LCLCNLSKKKYCAFVTDVEDTVFTGFCTFECVFVGEKGRERGR